MAEIFLAKQHGSEGFEKLVVLKRILPQFYADEQYRTMITDEAHVSMGLTHANIAQILDVGRAEGRIFLVLELVDGWDFGRLFKRAEKAGMPMPPGLGLHVIAEICRGLSYSHGKVDNQGRALGLVHRDVSPQNILVSEHGEVKLIDFGIAKVMTKTETTQAGLVKGKFAFMSPEQAQGQPIDSRSDLYAVGILLYILATGRRPYEAATDIEVLVKAQKGQYAPPEQVNPRVSPALAYAIRKSMTYDRTQRYQSADQVLVDIEAILRNEFGSVGQTALKMWLQALSRRDGELPIGRAANRFSQPGADPVEGKSFELDHDGAPRPTPVRRKTSPTGVVRNTGGVGRVTGIERRTSSDMAIPMGDDGPMRASSGRAASDLALPIPDEGRPTRVRYVAEKRGSGTLATVVVLGLIGGGGYAAWRVLDKEQNAGIAPAVASPESTRATGASKPTIIPTAPEPTAPEASRDARAAVAAPTQPTQPKQVRERRPAADPYARARAWQKPDEPVSPGIEIAPLAPAPAP